MNNENLTILNESSQEKNEIIDSRNSENNHEKLKSSINITKNIWNNSLFQIDSPIRFNIENNISVKIPAIPNEITGLNLEDYTNEIIELKKINEILEREINLLKSLILINNLDLNTSDLKPLYKENYFVEMCKDENLSKVINNDKLYNQQENLHVLQLKINNLKKRLDLFKKEFEEDREKFTEHMYLIHNKILEYFNSEIKMRKLIEDKVSSIKKLI